MKNYCLRLTALFCFLVFAAGSAHAEGYALYEYSARGIALGGAMMARKPDPSTVAYNPALLTRLPGTHAQVGVSLIKPQGKMKWRNGNEQDTTELRDSLWAIPSGYFTYQINDDWFFGVGEFSRFGLGFEYPHGWPGRFNIYEVALKTGSLNPNIAWKATDKLSVALGAEVVYVDLDIKKRAKGDLSSLFGPGSYMEFDTKIRKADAFGLGFNVAAHYQFSEQWAVGVQYRSPVKVKAYGDTYFSFKGGQYPQVPGLENQLKDQFDNTFKNGTAHATVILPESVQAGIAWSPIPELTIETGLIWTRWSRFRNLNIYLPNGMEGFTKKHWKDVWRFNAGIEYEPLDWLALRAGYVYDQSPMTSRYRDYLVPTADRHIYSIGAGFKWNAWTLDVAYAYIDPVGRSYVANEETHVLNSKVKDSSTNIFSVSLSYEF